MDLEDGWILQRLTNTEDHLTGRKSKPHRDQCTEAMVAFANSALPNKPGILYVGVNIWVFVGAGFFWLAILFAFAFGDYYTRIYMPLPTDWKP